MNEPKEYTRFDLRDLKNPKEISHYGMMLSEKAWKASENRFKKIKRILEAAGNTYTKRALKVDGMVKKKVGTKKQEMELSIVPVCFLYLPRYYYRIFLRIVLLASPVPGKNFGVLPIDVQSFFLSLPARDHIHFTEVMKFFLDAGFISMNSSGKMKLSSTLAYGCYLIRTKELQIMAQSFNKNHSRKIIAKTIFPSVVNFEEI